MLAGAEPVSIEGGPAGVLLLHGFTGTPRSMRPLADAFADAGFTVELPLLPGHGTSIDDLLATSWSDWSAAADAACAGLGTRCPQLFVAGLSMGGTLACWLAGRHRAIQGLICVNPLIEPPAASFLELLDGMASSGGVTLPSIGSDIAKPGAPELAYDATPIAGLRSLMEGVIALEPELGKIHCPLLLFTSPEDHVVPPTSSDLLASRVSGRVERVRCERSYHVATIDYDGPAIVARSVAFVRALATA